MARTVGRIEPLSRKRGTLAKTYRIRRRLDHLRRHLDNLKATPRAQIGDVPRTPVGLHRAHVNGTVVHALPTQDIRRPIRFGQQRNVAPVDGNIRAEDGTEFAVQLKAGRIRDHAAWPDDIDSGRHRRRTREVRIGRNR